MNVETIQMYPPIARVHFHEYRKKVRAHRAARLKAAQDEVLKTGRALRWSRKEKSLIEQEDEILMLSYQEMAKGQRVLNIQSVLQVAGRNDKHLPNLAIAAADWKEVVLTFVHGPEGFCFNESQWEPHFDNKKGVYSTGIPRFPVRTFGGELSNAAWRKSNNYPELPVRALVPAIPAHLRPDANLDEYHILFEADWQRHAPPDPILLKHIAGVMYSVIAQWDLTPIERSVLEGRIT